MATPAPAAKHSVPNVILLVDPDVLPDLEELRAIVDKARPKARPKQETSSVAKWQERIEALRKGGAKPKAIFDCLGCENKDFQGSYNAVKRLCRRLQELAGPTADDGTVLEQAQRQCFIARASSMTVKG